MRNHARTNRDRSAGFSLVELLVALGIIIVLAAVAIPNLRGFLRTYRIRGAASQVAGELQTARGRAVGKNVNLGVVLLIVSNNTYRWVIEDDQTMPFSGARRNMSVLLADNAQLGPLRTLPTEIQFATTGPNNRGIRFTRLGSACNPGAGASCPALDTGANQIAYDLATGDFKIRLFQSATQLAREVRVTSGGRVFTQ